MLSAVLFFKDAGASASVENLAIESKQVCFQKTFERYPQAFELAKIMNTYVPDLIFLDMSDWENALPAAADIRAFAPHSAIVGFGVGWASSQEAQSTVAGVTADLAGHPQDV